MLNTTSTFPSDTAINTGVGLSRGTWGPQGFAEAEARYREEQLTARRAAREARQAASHGTHRTNHPAGWASIRKGMTRWTTWPSPAPRRRSSAACPSSAGSRS